MRPCVSSNLGIKFWADLSPRRNFFPSLKYPTKSTLFQNFQTETPRQCIIQSFLNFSLTQPKQTSWVQNGIEIARLFG